MRILNHKNWRLLFYVLFYIGLLVSSLSFLLDSFEVYLSEATDYSETYEPITLNDLPTVTLCLIDTHGWNFEGMEFIHGKNIMIDAKFFEKKGMAEKPRYFTSPHLETHASNFKLSRKMVEEFKSSLGNQVRVNLTWLNWQCFKVTSKWKGGMDVDLQNYGVMLILKFNQSAKLPKRLPLRVGMKIWLTSEANSYGLALGRWFDGKDEPEMDYWHRTIEHSYVLNIVEVTES